MATLTFDTYDFISCLTKSGMEEKQAKAIAEGIKKIGLENVSTKDDIQNLKIDMLKWVLPLIFGQYAMLASLLFR